MRSPPAFTPTVEEDLAAPVEAEKDRTRSGLGEHCSSDRPTSSTVGPSGEITRLNGIESYLSKPSNYPHESARLLLFLTSGTGLKSINNKLQADKFAREGFLVVMPDLFDDDPAPNSSNAPRLDPDSSSLIEQVKLNAAMTVKSFRIDMWLARHTSERILPIIHKTIEGIREEFADAIAAGGGIYGVGYCTGAKYIIQLACQKPDSVMHGQKLADEEAGMVKSGPFIKAGAVAHGTLVAKEDFDGITSPLFLVCVENDQLFPADILNAGEEALKSSGITYQVKTYPGVPHGFAVEGEYEDEEIRESQRDAFTRMLGFFDSH